MNLPALPAIRKLLTILEETHAEAGQRIAPATREAAAVTVVGNPCAGRFEADLGALAAMGEVLGGLLGALGIEPGATYCYGKAAIVGEDGELEHAAALALSAKKRGGMGAAIGVPLGHKDAAFVRSHFDAMEVRVPDAPRRDEIVVAIVVTDAGRPLPRTGGLQAHDIQGQDGLR